MDDLLREFLTETAESLDVVDVELVKLEKDPQNKDVLNTIFRLVHTIKGTCGFLGLPRLETVAHHGETLLGKFRDGALPVTPASVTLILASLDRIKGILADLERTQQEPPGDDSALLAQLEAAAKGEGPTASAPATPAPIVQTPEATAPVQTLDRPLKPGEVPLDELERIFRETAVEVETPAAAPAPARAETPEPEHAPAADGAAKSEPSVAQQSIRVNVEVLEDLMTMVSELVLTRNQLLEMVRHLDNSEFKGPLQRLSNVTAELQEGVMKTRMQPIGNAWQKLPRIVRDLSRELGKKINLVMLGAETELDRQVLELIKDPLTHMVRNSADHGLEGPAERKAAGKPETGTITLRAYHEGGHILIEIADDGKGLPKDKIKAKALANGLATEADIERMSDAQINKFIFAPGFSTAAKVTAVSGRGVGMDVVRTNIEQIGGAIDLKSVQGQGTTFTIKIPLTLAIVSALIVEAAGQRFAIPQLAVTELVRARPGGEHRLETINKTPVLRLRNRLLPLVHLADILRIGGTAARDEAYVIVTQIGAQTFGIVVDSVFDTEEIVVKPVSSLIRDIPMFSGNTILGDGSVIMIVDPNGIAGSVGSSLAERTHPADSDAKNGRAAQDERTSLLLFRAGGPEPKAVPLSLVTRLEEIEAAAIEPSNGRTLVQYRGRLMPLVTASPGQSLKTQGRQPVLVFTDEGRAMGLAVDEIVDIVEEKLTVEIRTDQPGVLGSAVIKGKATEVVDVGHHLRQAFEDWFARGRFGGASARKRILLVDDSPFFRNMVAPLLTTAGYEVTTTETAEAALRLKEDGARFDCIVSDVAMPGMDGFAFARAVKADPAWGATPVVALSAHASPEDEARGREAGFDDYVAKFDRDQVVAAIRTRLMRAESETLGAAA